ncbi:MAG: selenide, water dikinase SelD, partial [Chloroflexota bacterium]
DLLVGLGHPDDAAVWRLDENRALVITTDFFTPVVDDAYDYGAIAAANSLSDIYAMGGNPGRAVNVAGIPADLPNEITSEILRGGAEKALEAGVIIAGGHSVQDKEPKYGLMALGFVDPAKAMTKAGFRAGDQLVLTKPLGFGVTSTALKRQQADAEDVDEVVGWMKKLNSTAAELALALGIKGATDVTGFSLLGHGVEVAEASGVGLRIEYAKVGMVSGAMKYAEAYTFPGGAFDNRDFFGGKVSFEDGISEAQQMLLFDPQTSGGLLLAVPADKLDDFVANAKNVEQPYWVIGEVVEGHGIEVVK